jgi:hypothetical protein
MRLAGARWPVGDASPAAGEYLRRVAVVQPLRATCSALRHIERARITAAIWMQLAYERAVSLRDFLIGGRRIDAQHDVEVCLRIIFDGHGS